MLALPLFLCRYKYAAVECEIGKKVLELKLPEFLDNYIVVVMNQNDKETILRRTNNFIKLIQIFNLKCALFK